MTNIVHFVPAHAASAASNRKTFIDQCRHALTVFGSDLDWETSSWPAAGITFGNLEQTTRLLDPAKTMRQPFLDFAKAYFRYQQGHRPNQAKYEIRALKCLERALTDATGKADIADVNGAILDAAASIARGHYASGAAYHTGRELARLAKFLSDKVLLAGQLDWKSPIERPGDTVRTGLAAKLNREKKIPAQEALDTLADIFAQDSSEPRDIFTSSVAAMLLCAPSRISEVLSLPQDCEVWEAKKDGTKAYGWRFQPSKDGVPCIKWIPNTMASLAQEALQRLRRLSAEARQVAAWHESRPEAFYRHATCPDLAEDAPLSARQAATALGLAADQEWSARAGLERQGLKSSNGAYTLRTLNLWVRAQLPVGFPWFDKARGLRYSEALTGLLKRQLRTDLPTSPILLWRPTANTLNDDLCSRETKPGYFAPNIFSRHASSIDTAQPLKLTSHQFRHYLNTVAQRGGLSQAQIARWSGRADARQNRIYDHMTEFELVDMLRSHDTALSLDQPLTEIAQQLAAHLPVSTQEFNALAIPTAHVTEFGFCVHDYAMSPCERFRDCLNCTEQVCIKGDGRLNRIKGRYEEVRALCASAEQEKCEGTAGADRWLEIHLLSRDRLKELIELLESPSLPAGAIVRLRNPNEFSPLRRALAARRAISGSDRPVSSSTPSRFDPPSRG